MLITRNRLGSFEKLNTSINDLVLFHGKLGGDLLIKEGYLYLYSDPRNSSVFAEHVFYNEKGYSCTNELQYELAYLESNPFIQKIKAKVTNTALIDFDFFKKVSKEISTRLCDQADLADLFDKFEESEYRIEFLDLLKAKGFDSAVILNDMSPEEAGGDWGFKESFVLFYPEKQIILQ